ncbi:putative trna wybutosine-synthesizing protein 3 protein [Botrytis fragariae]|uniref:tRNA(Phe) 7-[(3-amino-3-carboxypropyl)-4-demethylwyosine(37)-N(4)]-methyltransferase n=1 Tax=Botrytis fragariae TaxID=1964551 RepID=A0A8H6ATB2_9HELO|nr:putative trna wybutosine-synthesizing protein 3 protein [Botrytis fragariae]KAF5873264.1 putative trna wybutosine-synthesizing protein 3 protein [Botrytis fragariae]
MSLPQSFISKKKLILSKLAVPTDEYDDLSPKGSVDEGIRELIDEINSLEGCVTTSSCAGRVSVFLEGKKNSDDGVKSQIQDEAGMDGIPDVRAEKTAGFGGKGGGGKWLYVSHDAIEDEALSRRENEGTLCELLGMRANNAGSMIPLPKSNERDLRHIHFKFEPMILHVLTASLEQAQKVLSAALQAGFRESGALNLISTTSEPATPMVGIRCMGLTLESLVGVYHEAFDQGVCLVDNGQLGTLMRISNERFKENTKRIERFRVLLNEAMNPVEKKKLGENGEDWEDPQARKERKRAEGLRRAQELKEAKVRSGISENQDSGELPVDPTPVDYCET